MHSSTTAERITAVLSVLVAIALLGAVVTAQQARRETGDQLTRLESDLRFQLDLIARFDRAAHKARLVQLEEVLQAWRQSMQTAADRRLLAGWFEEAIAATVSNSSAALPSAPALGAAPPIIVATAPPSPPVDEPETPDVAAPQMADEAPTVEAAEAETPAEEAEAPPVVVVEHSIAQPGLPPAEGLPYSTAGDQDANPNEAEAEVLPVQINLAELAARIRGFHQSLDDIEATLVASAQMPPEQLEAVVARLEALAAQHRFLRLYYEALTEAEQRLIDEPRSMAETIRFAAAQFGEEEPDDDFLAEFAATLPTEELTLAARLEKLSKQFAPADETEASEK